MGAAAALCGATGVVAASAAAADAVILDVLLVPCSVRRKLQQRLQAAAEAESRRHQRRLQQYYSPFRCSCLRWTCTRVTNRCFKCPDTGASGNCSSDPTSGIYACTDIDMQASLKSTIKSMYLSPPSLPHAPPQCCSWAGRLCARAQQEKGCATCDHLALAARWRAPPRCCSPRWLIALQPASDVTHLAPAVQLREPRQCCSHACG